MVRLWSPARAVLAVALAAASLSACTRYSRDPVRRQESLLGTVCTLSVYQRVPESVFAGFFALVRGVEQTMGVSQAGSEIAEVNRAAGATAVEVSAETFDIVRRAVEFGRLSGGAFDITVGPLVELWGIGTDHARVPSAAELQAGRGALGLDDVALDEAARTIELRRPGMALDLGGIAKGYAADKAASYLRAQGVKHALLDFGGNIVVVGAHPTRPSWRVGVQDPVANRGVYLGILSVTDTAVVTSGTYERFFERGGIRYHHILDTRTGEPVHNGVLSTTVVCASSTTADALSTALFVLGPERGLALARSVPGVEAMVITDDRRVHLTPGMRSYFTVTDPTYRLAED